MLCNNFWSNPRFGLWKKRRGNKLNARTVLEAWKKTMIEKSDYLSQYLAEDFTIEFLGKDGVTQSLAEHLEWCLSEDSPVVDDIKIIAEKNGVCVGTHTAKFPDEDGSDVMFFGKLIDGKAIEWKVLRSVY